LGTSGSFAFPPKRSRAGLAGTSLRDLGLFRDYRAFREYVLAYTGTCVFGSSRGSFSGAPGTICRGITPAQVRNE